MSYIAYVAILFVIAFAASSQVRGAVLGLFAKKNLPLLPPAGPLPTAELHKYYSLEEAPLAWERVRGWNLNQVPQSLTEPGRIDHAILMPTLLDFCNGSTGKLIRDFNFLVAAILRVDFDPAALGGQQGQGLMTVHTPSGQTRLLTSAGFAQAVQQAVARAHAQA